MFRAFFTLLLLIAVIYSGSSQDNCSARLKQAKELFESGQIETIPELLDSCLNAGSLKNEEVQAFHLLIQAYLFDYNRDKAMEVMYRFLKKYPEYKFSSMSPVEVREIYDAYQVRPNWGFGFSLGGNVSQVKATEKFTVFNSQTFQSEYKLKPGFQAGVQVEKFLGNQWGIILNCSYKYLMYQNIEKNSTQSNTSQIVEHVSWLSFPLSVNYSIGNNKWAPILFCGAELNYLIQSKGDLTYSMLTGSNSNSISETVDLSKRRNTIVYSTFGGVGVRLIVPKGFFKLYAGYNYTFSKYINVNKRFDAPEQIFNYGVVDDDLNMSHIFINISYTRNIFRIKAK